jgi:MoxR-like ATPase
VLDAETILGFQQLVRRIPVPEPVLQCVQEMARLNCAEASCIRAGQALVLGGKARAALHGRFCVSVGDIWAVAGPALRHRARPGCEIDSLLDPLSEQSPHESPPTC